MKSIWKFELPVANFSQVEMPKNAEFLSFQAQGKQLQIWAMVDPEAKLETRTLRIVGTGYAIADKPEKYLGTTQLLGGNLVWHLFEVGNG